MSTQSESETRKQAGITPQQKQQFLDDGFLLVKDVLPQQALQPLMDELSQKVEEGTQAAVKEGILDSSKTFDNEPFETRLGMVSQECTDPNWIWRNSFSHQKIRTAGMFILRTAPELLDVVGSVIGQEILAHPQYNFRAKLPNQDITVIPWHQDLAYLIPEEAGETLVVNVWLPLVRAYEENGCMQVIRGSHLYNLIDHNYQAPTLGHTGGKGISETDLPSGEVVTAELDVGDILLTNERVVHRGLPNRGNTVRWSVDTRYSQIGLPTGRAHVPGFVARSEKNPETVAKSHHDWNRQFA
ncbi:MAG: phytanoyl-CoA dioxygenase family protein [Candidatus Poribacteria bacterium]|nr:phytanoyl-CoA dioxygenase family protein [Candidatus Poribacteria bacterium]